MALIQWQDSFEIGIAEVDEQHREFVSFINRLEQNAFNHFAEAEAQAVLRELTLWAVKHFALEERIMAENSASFTDHHAKMHHEMLSYISGLLKKLRRDSTINTHEFLSYLKSWLINHIMREDARLRIFNHKYEAIP